MNIFKKNNVLTVFAVMLMVCVLLCSCGKKAGGTEPTAEMTQAAETVQETTEAPEVQLIVESVEEQDDMMVVTTSFGQVKFPFAFGDLIHVKAVTDDTVPALEFSALISGDEYPIFAFRFGSSEGIVLGTLQVPGEAEARTVSAEIYAADEDALAEKTNTFYAAQEAFNDVVASLKENQGFAAAE